MATWTAHVEGGPKRVNHAAVSINGNIYSFGGYCTGDDFGVRQDIDIHKFNTVAYTWSKIDYFGKKEDIPYQRYGHTAVAFEGSCVIYGGRNDINGVSDNIYMFDVATRTWHRPKVTGSIPLARDGHSCCVIGDNMYLFGGFEEESMEFSNTVFFLNLRTFTWYFSSASGDQPLWRDFHTATAWRDQMVVFGGRSDEEGPIHTTKEIYDNSIYMFDTERSQWSAPEVTGDIPDGRRSHCAFEHHGKIYVFGGYNSTSETHYNDLHVYDPEERRWTLCKPGGVLPRIRRRACCCKDGNRLFIFGGTSPDTSKSVQSYVLVDLSDLHILDMAPSLRMLCMLKVLKYKLRYENIIPIDVTQELQILSKTCCNIRGPNG